MYLMMFIKLYGYQGALIVGLLGILPADINLVP